MNNGNNSSFIKLSFSNGYKNDEIFFTFDSLGSKGFDHKDAPKLSPLTKSPRIAAMIISEGLTYKINNLPSHYDSVMTFPLQILSLDLHSSGKILGMQDTLSLSVDELNLPININFDIYDSFTGMRYDADQLYGLSIITESLDSLNFDVNGPLNQYLNYGNHRYFISLYYNSLGEISSGIFPKKHKLFQNYPNPFNQKTIISYNLSNKQFVEISIFDIIGRNVKTLINEMQNPGTRTVKWDGKDNFGNDVATGMYFYSIKAGTFRDDKKMILIK